MKIKKISFFLLFLFASVTGFSQKYYFVYLQTEDNQPFFVKMNKKILSSTASGYLILSKMADSTYSFAIGFPQNKWPEQIFSVAINKKDHGYLLKNFGEKGWGLFNLQTLSVQMSSTASAKVNEQKTEINNNVSLFTELLSKATDDPSIKEKPVFANTEIKEEVKTQENIAKIKTEEISKELPDEKLTQKPIEVVENTIVKKEEPAVVIQELTTLKSEDKTTSSSSSPEQFKRTAVTKRSESSTTEGFGLVYIDEIGEGINDTIRILIPNPRLVITLINEEPKNEKKFIEILPDTAKKKDEIVSENKPANREAQDEKGMLNKKCNVVAEESDFFKLRKNMAAAEGDENMLLEAKNYFKTKCFTSEQVRNLGLLFLKDEGKYNFFDLAYNYVSDTEKFIELQTELKDPYYINRFKAMLRN
jgi:hypothetical protein